MNNLNIIEEAESDKEYTDSDLLSDTDSEDDESSSTSTEDNE